MSEVEEAPSPPPGWYRDPVDPTVRRRWWDGAQWSARVRAFAAPAHEMDGISWRPFILGLAAPAARDRLPDLPAVTHLPVTIRPVVAAPEPVEAIETTQPIETIQAIETIRAIEAEREIPAAIVPGPRLTLVPPGESMTADPLAAAFGSEASWPERRRSGPREFTRRVLVGVIAASLCALGAGVAGAVVDTTSERPQITPATTYVDALAGFRLEYPDGWRLQSKTAGQFLRFDIGDRDAAPTQANTVSVLVGTKPEDLPTLEAAASSFTTTLRAQLPGIALDRASHTRLLDSTGLRLRFTVPGLSAPVVVDQYVGRTTAGRALTITVAVRDPRTAPKASVVKAFVRSLQPA